MSESEKFTNNEFIALRAKVEAEYRNITSVRCPYLDSEVIFNAKGLDHIKLKEWNKARNRSDQYIRLKLLHLAPEVLKKSRTVQGIESGKRFERIKVNSRWDTILTDVTYYEFIAVLEKCRVRVIVKKVGTTPPYFWSIIPNWKQGRLGKKLFDGNLEED
jgi:hypothetical protein